MSRNDGNVFDFDHDGEVSTSDPDFEIGAILNALAETEADVKITISIGKDEDYESMDRDELESVLAQMHEQREELANEEPEDISSDEYDEWEECCEEIDEKIEEIEALLYN